MSRNDSVDPDSDGFTTIEESDVEYDPEAIGTAEFSAGDPDTRFDDYGLETVPILHHGQDTGRRFIRRNGQLIADVSSDYELVPNETVVHAANEAAQRLGATPFNEFSGDWYVTLDDHVFQDSDGRRVHALYAWDEPVEYGDGDSIQFGFAVHNSIDGTLAFQVGLFTFRHACANMVTMGVKGRGMSFDQRDVVAHQSHKHTSGLDIDIDALATTIQDTMALGDTVDERYRAWRDQFITVGQVKGLLQRMPAKDLPEWITDIGDQLDAARENQDLEGEVGLSEERVDSIVRDMLPANETVWSTYNDLTESIWHDSSTNDMTKDRKFTQLHRVFEPAPNLR